MIVRVKGSEHEVTLPDIYAVRVNGFEGGFYTLEEDGRRILVIHPDPGYCARIDRQHKDRPILVLRPYGRYPLWDEEPVLAVLPGWKDLVGTEDPAEDLRARVSEWLKQAYDSDTLEKAFDDGPEPLARELEVILNG